MVSVDTVLFSQIDANVFSGRRNGLLLYHIPEHEQFEGRLTLDALVNHFWSTMVVIHPRAVAIVIPPHMGCSLGHVPKLFRLDRFSLSPAPHIQAFNAFSPAQKWLQQQQQQQILK